jgi:uncharacterized repeat protein (TIGR02543 family)
MKKTKKVNALLVAVLLLSSFLLFTACTGKPVTTQAEQDAAAFVALVNAIPSKITSEDAVAEAITAAETAYAALSDDAKAVEGVSAAKATLDAKRAAYDAEIEKTVLAPAKATAILEIQNYPDSAHYTINSGALSAAIAHGIAAVNGATDIAGINAAVSNAKAAIDQINTDEEEQALAATIDSIEITANPTKMSYIVGQTFNPAGMVVKANSASGTPNNNFTAYTISPNGALTMADTVITIAVAANPSIKTTLTVTIADKQKLATPIAADFSVGGTGSFEIDRRSQGAEYLSTVSDFDHLKVYVYESNSAISPVADFTVTIAPESESLRLTSSAGTHDITKTSGQYNSYSALGKGNLYVLQPETEAFMVAMLGNGFDYGAGYFFKAQLIAKTGSDSADSDLGPVTAIAWMAKQMEVTFDANGGMSTSTVKVARGSAVAEPTGAAIPTRPNHNFVGWYNNSAGTGSPFSFATPITENITLYAKWLRTGSDEKAKLPTVKVDVAEQNNFMGNGSANGANFTYNRGQTAISASDWGSKVDSIVVTVYSSPSSKAGTDLLQFKIIGTGGATAAGLIISSLDGSITHYASQNLTDPAYNQVSTTNAFIVGKYFSLFVNLIRLQDGKAALSAGMPLYFSFQLIAPADSEDYIDGDESDICKVSAERVFKTVAFPTGDYTFDLGGTNSAAINSAIVVFDTDGGTAIPNRYLLVGTLGQTGNFVGDVPIPTKPGYTFDGWYTDAQKTAPIDLTATKINADMKTGHAGTVTLYAKWIQLV